MSDFEAWHFVLNNWYYSSTTSEKEWEQDEKRFDVLSKTEQQHIKEKSWQQILILFHGVISGPEMVRLFRAASGCCD